MSITRAIDRAFEMKEKRGWDKLYWAIDLHNTMLPSCKEDSEKGHSVENIYPSCLKALQMLSQSDEHCLILFTATKPKDISNLLLQLEHQGVHFDYMNENPECEDTEYADFSEKFYYDVIVDDKAGFNPATGWILIQHAVELIGEIKEKQSENICDMPSS